jgi:hypothetical protein
MSRKNIRRDQYGFLIFAVKTRRKGESANAPALFQRQDFY